MTQRAVPIDTGQGNIERHAVYDPFIVTLGRPYGEDHLITTGGGFDDCYAGEDVTYINPIRPKM